MPERLQKAAIVKKSRAMAAGCAAALLALAAAAPRDQNQAISPAPQFSLAGGVYTNDVKVRLTASGGAPIR